MVVFQPERLKDFAESAYLRLGVPERDAALLADTLVAADLAGHQSHGVMRTF
jgi:LDH2 family malate/lactate/ureidoglycolate dehydrogenase